MAAVNSARPLPAFNYVLTTGWATSKVNHGLNTVYNAFPTYYLVQGAGANLEASRETSSQRRPPERRLDCECTRSLPSRGMRGQGSHHHDKPPHNPSRSGLPLRSTSHGPPKHTHRGERALNAEEATTDDLGTETTQCAEVFFSSRSMMEVLASYNETSEHFENAILSVSSYWRNDRLNVDPQDLYLQIKSHGPCLLLPAEALVIHTLASSEPEWPCPKAVDGLEEIQ
ncbi:hypothetical protein Cgig2_031375 [Carnegiea gigantea]|uniref:Uncharacterized protein n=1 Tax=Carnegiea gigantea TaxID=171969 RepID=A0A9Q1Q4Q7_9CARY|nr:hypothetical protein Cgig2_031375 [Carnegiea gigantea]